MRISGDKGDYSMCATFDMGITDEELEDICRTVERNLHGDIDKDQITFKMKTSGEIRPTDIVPVQTRNGYEAMSWCFRLYDGKPLLHARSETALDKPTFKTPMRSQRCVIPASRFFEWKKDGKTKTKYQFYLPDQTIYLAGCYRKEPDSKLMKFVILTREATDGVEDIHDRMPVIIPQSRIEEWLCRSYDVMGEAVTKLVIEEAARSA